MPIINTSSSITGFEYASFESIFEFEAEAEVTTFGLARFDAGFEFVAASETQFSALAEFDGGLEFAVTGFLNNAPNILALAEFDGGLEFSATSVRGSEMLSVFESGFEFVATEEFRTPEIFTFDLILDILPDDITPANYIHLQPRLKVDGVEIPIISGTVEESSGTSGRTLDVRLARIADKSLIGIYADIEFGFGTKTAGVWNESTFETLLDGAVRQSLSHTLSWGDNQPADAVTFSSVSGSTAKMMKTAQKDLVIYDSSRLTLQQKDFEILYDSQGRQFTTELKPIAGLRLNRLLQEIAVVRCGFSGYRTNLPDFRIQRVDVEMGGGLIDSISGYIGMFEPVLFVEDDLLWVIDTTIALPSGFPAPRTVSVSQYRTLSKQDTRRLVDVLLVDYVEDKLDYDYITTRTEIDEQLEGDLEAEIEKLIREYRKYAQPFVIQREEAYQVNKEFRGVGGQVVKTSSLTLTYDSRNRITERLSETQELLPDLLNEISPGLLTLMDSESIVESFSWSAHPFDTRREYMSQRTLVESSLVAIDADNPQLGSPYERKLAEVYLAGNVTTDQVSIFKRIRTTMDSATPQRDGTVKIRRTELNHLLNLIAVDEDADPVGDISVSGLAASSQKMLVFHTDGAVRNTDRIESFHAGELPATLFIPLARRRLKMIREYAGDVSFEVIGFDRSLRKGMSVRLTGRGETIADCLILGRSINVEFGSITMNLTGRPIA